MPMECTIIGAGIVGMCTAVALQQRGVAVHLIDEREPGTGTSFGNAGLVSVDSCVPIALPGMLRQVPRWLADAKGPLTVRPSYLPKAAPWLMRWIQAGASERKAARQSRALHQLHQEAVALYRSLLGPDAFHELIHVRGQLHVWENPVKSPGDLLGERLRQQNGVVPRQLTGQDIFDLVPGMDRAVSRAEFYEKNGHVANPHHLVQRLFRIFLEQGGTHLQQKVNGITRLPGSSRYRVITATCDLSTDKLVICSGAWSRQLLNSLGLDVPLETERGYHLAFDRQALDINVPVLHKERAFGVTPMTDNIRVAGFVEIAGLDAPPDMGREAVLAEHAKRLFPQLDVDMKQRFWLGMRPSMPDSLPVLGGIDAMPNLYFGFGHGHTGITGAPKSAEILANMITGTANTIDVTPYKINRF